jgi:hypothetical protein
VTIGADTLCLSITVEKTTVVPGDMMLPSVVHLYQPPSWFSNFCVKSLMIEGRNCGIVVRNEITCPMCTRSSFLCSTSVFVIQNLDRKQTDLFGHKFQTRCHMWQTVLFCDIVFFVPWDNLWQDRGTTTMFTFEFSWKIYPSKTGPYTRTFKSTE